MKLQIGESIKRVDAPEKTAGQASYIADMRFRGMLYAKTLRSSYPRARIKSIDIPEIPTGYYTVDRRDIPGMNRVKMITDDQPFFAEGVVNYVGEPILLIVGPQKPIVARILSEIEVQYEEMEPIFTIDESENMKGSPIHGEDNCFVSYEIKKGNPDAAFEGAFEIIEKEYRTGLQEHIYLEPQGVIGVYKDGRVTVYGSMQCPYYVKNALVQGFGWDQDRIQVVQTTTGGAFGGKEEYPSLIAGHVAFAAVKTGKPVQLIFDRREDIQVTTKRHPSIIRIKTALDANRSITAMDINIKLDGGAYEGLSSVVLQRALFMSTGVYNIPNARVRGKVLATNNVPTGAFRGFGAPQSLFAIEMHLQTLAEHYDLDPIDFKMQHMLKSGDHTITHGLLRDPVKLPEMIDLVLRMSEYRKKYRSLRNTEEGVLRGIGLSLFYHGCAFTGSGEKDKIKAVVKLKKRGNGKAEILVSNVEMGQGPQTTLRKIVAKTLETTIDKVIYENPDTDMVPDSGPTVASRTVMIVGGLLYKAAQELKLRWNEAPEVEVRRDYEQPEYMQWDQETFQGDAYPVYSWGTNVVEVEIDPSTYVITVKGIWGVYDVGTPIDERIIQGQIEGGIVQGLGYATIEVMQCRNGRMLQDSITDYIIPTSVDFGRIESKLIDNYYDYGPYGAKCAGELPFVGVAPALASAVQNALGIPIESVPVTPEYLLEVIEGEDTICPER